MNDCLSLIGDVHFETTSEAMWRRASLTQVFAQIKASDKEMDHLEVIHQ